MQKTLPCPHCSQEIQEGLFKGFMGVKSCPHCHKGIKFNAGPFGRRLKAGLPGLAVMLLLIVLQLVIFGRINQFGYIVILVVGMILATSRMKKIAHFEKTEDTENK